MVTLQQAPRKRRSGATDGPISIPSPEQVRAAAAEIRKSWTPGERRERALLARSLFMALASDGPPCPADSRQPLRPKCPPSR